MFEVGDHCPHCGEELLVGYTGKMFCPSCDWDEENDDGVFEHCPECGGQVDYYDKFDLYHCASCDWNNKDEELDHCPECGAPLWELGDDKCCTECDWDQIFRYETIGEHCPMCGEELVLYSTDNKKHCLECEWEEDDGYDDMEYCPECGEKLIQAHHLLWCSSCDWNSLGEDSEKCPECGCPLESGDEDFMHCPNCDWDEKDSLETIGEYCPKCGVELVDRKGKKSCIECSWNEDDGYDDMEYCPECGTQLVHFETRDSLWCPNCEKMFD